MHNNLIGSVGMRMFFHTPAYPDEECLWKYHHQRSELRPRLTGRAISTLKKVAESALSKMQMGVNGKGLGGICKSFMLLQTKLRDSAFSKREGLHM